MVVCFLFSCSYQVQAVSFENWMVTFRKEKCVMTVLDTPLKNLPFKGGEEEYVGIVELQALQFALVKGMLLRGIQEPNSH